MSKTKNMPKIFITGGISSGKSGFAERQAVSIYKGNIISGESGLAELSYKPVHFVATAKFVSGDDKNDNASVSARTETRTDFIDEEMALKIKKHKKKRQSVFIVHENFNDLNEEIKGICRYLADRDGVILIDSMTLWLSSVFKGLSDYDFAAESILMLSKYFKEIKCAVITVSDSLGFNMVPADAYLRKFIELNGLMEQELSSVSDKAYCVIAGNPVSLK